MKKRWIWILAIVLLGLLAFDSRLAVRTYRVEVPGMTSTARLALVTDLHSCKWGEDQTQLIEAVIDQKPDVVLLGGDVFDDKMPDTNTELFLRGIADRFPCYYVTGNHEYWSKKEAFSKKMAILEELGVKRLQNEAVRLNLGGTELTLCGLDDPAGKQDFSRQLAQLAEKTQDGYTILLSHRPERFVEYAEYGFDLVLSGHAHGGQWRIPLLLNGLLAPDQGLFPRYAGGRYERGGTTMLVSRGLARESTRIPRIFNRPDLVVVELSDGTT